MAEPYKGWANASPASPDAGPLEQRVDSALKQLEDIDEELRERARPFGPRVIAGYADTTEATVDRWLRGGGTTLLTKIASALDHLEREGDGFPGVDFAQFRPVAEHLAANGITDPVLVEVAEGRLRRHTVRGRPIDNDPQSPDFNPGQYGRTHDMDCPGCEGTPFTASPRSETYWSS